MNKELKDSAIEAELITVEDESTSELAARNDLVMMIGQARAYDSMMKIADVTTLKMLEKIKKTKEYKDLAFTGPNGKVVTVTTFDQVCQALVGKTANTVNEKIRNLNQLGNELYESLSDLGVGSRGFRAVRAMSEAELIEFKGKAIEAENANEIKEILQQQDDEIESLKDALDDNERHAAKQETALEKATADLEKFRAKNKITGELTPEDEFVEVAHVKATEWSDRSLDAMNRFELVIDMLAEPTAYGLNPDEAKDTALFGMAASIVGYSLHSMLARAQELSDKLNEYAGDFINYQPGEMSRLTPEQIKRIETARSTMMAAHDGQEMINDNKVADSLNKRGRRKVVKS